MRSLPMESIISILSCTPEEYWSVYEGPSQTDDLAEIVVTNVIKKCEEHLRAANVHYRLDNLLYSMLREAPHPAGKRYVATALYIAYTKGREATVVELAKSWMETLFLPLLTITNMLKPEGEDYFEYYSGQHPIDSSTIRYPLRATLSSDLGIQIVKRDGHTCAITEAIDDKYARSLLKEGAYITPRPRRRDTLRIAHIIPLAFNDDIDPSVSQTELFRDFFESWTQLDSRRGLKEQKINSPANAIYLAEIEHYELVTYKLYFDKEAVINSFDQFPDSPNKYMVKPTDPNDCLSLGIRSKDVEFPSFEQSGVEPPNPTFLRVHASIGKVLHESGAEGSASGSVTVDAEGGIAIVNNQLSELTLQ